uniref:CW-type domain-containing protein n=1 Tax=Cajanus cajan TaxID=3821 RepID=A0A151TW97_CAJCA|nr:hypothetical protein KK1_010585 [Cajanus cajan]
MVESELEEGEACSFQNHEDYDATVDPDVDLSYIDEKIQDVLGHFQKDFEGGVSAENLGSKFGGYGSFLPTHQRSPVWSRPRTPQKNQGQNTPRSPNNLQLEGGQGDAVQCSAGTQSLRPVPGSANSSRMAANKGHSSDDGISQEKYMTTTNANTSTSKQESLNKKVTSTSDQKTLKVRIKMGPDNLSTRKNAAIYSEIGLDVSPSSSLDDSPSESEGISRGPQDAPFESPTIILQIMTNIPLLLSPLPDDILELTLKETRARDSIPGLVHLDDPESLDMPLIESNNEKGDRKSLGGRKMKSLEGCESLMEVKGSTKKNARSDVGVLSRKEQNTDALTMEELGPKERAETTSTEVNGFAEKAKGSSARKVVGDKVSHDEYTVKDNPHGDKNCHSMIAESNVSKVRPASNSEEPPKKASLRGSLCEQDSMTLTVVTEHQIPGVPKTKKSSDDSSTSKNETEDVRVPKNLGKTRDTYKDFFGELEDEEDRMDSLETPCEEKVKESEVVERSAPTTNCGAKERSSENGKGIPAMIPTVEIEDNWVQCDKCHKWRLLPLGTNPDNLPEKWLCSMLNWLPDMNRCSFSEDETTKALVAFYQGPPLDGQSNLQNVSVPGGKKKLVKEIPNSINKDSFPQSSYPIKKNLPSAVKSRSLNDVNKSPAVSEADFPAEKHKNKQRMMEYNSDRGDMKSMKVKSRRDPDQDFSRPSKKSKADRVHSSNEEWIVEQNGTTRKVGKERMPESAENTNNKGQCSLDEGSLDLGNCDSIGSVKKRKLKGYQNAQTYSPGSGRTDKKVSHTKNQKFRQNPESGMSQRSLDGMECSKRDLGSVQASVAATSSSSKVSGSHKTKASFQEVKGSPVESVSSSPIRISNTDKFTNKEIIGKDDSHDIAVADSPRRCSDREDDGGSDRSGTARKDKSFIIAHRKNGIESGLEDNNDSFKAESHADKVKNTSSPSQLKDQSPLHEAKHKDGKIKLQEKSGLKPDQNALYKQELFHAPVQNQLPDCDTERTTKRSLLERTDQEVHGKGKPLSSLPSEGSQVETLGRCPRPVGLHKGNGDNEVDPSKVDDVSRLQKKQLKKTDHQNGNQQIGSRNPILNGHKSKELDAPSPVRRDSYSHAANNAVKEAKDLKHLADRLKNSGSTVESTSLYFQAALKFLHGASLLESGNNDNAKHNEMIQSKQMYSSTAKLCEFCAHEYEKSKDMASAALAYKCMEVAYMRVVYSSHGSANRDRHELQTALQMIPLGESPSSSASDVDNVNNSTAADKVTISKSVNSPQVAGSHAQDVCFAMDASRRSRIAFAAANSSPGVGKNADGISSIKKALDFSFQDVEGLLHLVRVAVEAINR